MSFTVATKDLAGRDSVGSGRVLADEMALIHFRLMAPANVWSTNDERKMHPKARAALVDQLKTVTMWSFRHGRRSRAERALEPGRVGIIIPFKTNRRRDPHNYCGTVLKTIIDAMVLEGAWPDDTPEYVGHIEPILEVDPSGKGRIVVAVFPMGQRWSYRA